MGSLRQGRVEVCRHRINLPLDGVARHRAARPALGHHGAQPDIGHGKQRWRHQRTAHRRRSDTTMAGSNYCNGRWRCHATGCFSGRACRKGFACLHFWLHRQWHARLRAHLCAQCHAVQGKVGRACHGFAFERRLKLRARLQPLHGQAPCGPSDTAGRAGASKPKSLRP